MSGVWQKWINRSDLVSFSVGDDIFLAHGIHNLVPYVCESRVQGRPHHIVPQVAERFKTISTMTTNAERRETDKIQLAAVSHNLP